MIHTYVLLPTNPSMPDASSNHSHTTLLHSRTYRPPAIHSSRLRLSPSPNRIASDGNSQTR